MFFGESAWLSEVTTTVGQWNFNGNVYFKKYFCIIKVVVKETFLQYITKHHNTVTLSSKRPWGLKTPTLQYLAAFCNSF